MLHSNDDIRKFTTRMTLFGVVLGLFTGFFVGNITKRCEKCVECDRGYKKTEIRKAFDKGYEKEKEKIKKESNETVKKIIIDNDTHVADSILREFAKERFDYGK